MVTMDKQEALQNQDKVKKEHEESAPNATRQVPGTAGKQRTEEAKKQAEALEKTQAALAEANDKYLRLYAEFENFKRRAAKEKLAFMETASEDILKQLLPIIDNFERVLNHVKLGNNNVNEGLQTGMKLLYDKLMHLLQQAGVQPIEVTKGSDFNAELHEAVSRTAVTEEEWRGKVISVAEKGYRLKDKTLRFAKVVIGT